MQEFHPVPGLAGRLFGGGGVAAKEAEEVRCPRCESANTKFCYYNNYNLSQPRHFCKSCRRYWTKGGLLRNVPVGGGCRKTKRPAPSSDVIERNAHRDAQNARSSAGGGDSSSASATTTNAAAAPASNASSAVATQPRRAGAFTLADDALSLPPAPMFADQAATFASLFAPLPPTPQLSPAFASFAARPKAEDDAVAASVTPAEQQLSSESFTADISPTFAARSPGGQAAAATDWAPPPPTTAVLDAGMFDLAGDASYWNAASWTDPDGTIYQLP